MYMQKVNNIATRVLFCLLAAAISVSCLIEKADPSAERQNVMIELRVSEMNSVRAVPTETEETINSLHVYAFYGSTLAGYIERKATGLDEPFYMDLDLPESGIHNVDFYLIANAEEMAYENTSVSLSRSMTKAQLEDISFTGLVSGNALPMYCVKTEAVNVDALSDLINDEAGHEGHLVLKQTVRFSLERSLAKMSVFAAKVAGTSGTPQILSVDLLAEGTRYCSYLFPQDNDVLDAVPSMANNRTLLRTLTLVTEEVTKGTAAAGDPSNYGIVLSDVYLPEVTYGSSSWNVSSGSERAAVLHVEYNLGEGQPYRHAYVYLPPIRRNTHYKVCILIDSEGQIIINYVVADWEDHEMPDLSFDYPTHSYLRESVPAAEEEMSAKPSSAATMSETEPFTGYFQMTYPENDEWTPTLLGLNGAQCEVKVFEYPGTIEIPQTEWPIAASDKWYRITVSPKVGYMTAGEEVQLALTYNADGFDTIEYLLINGSHQEYYWPYSGQTSQDANYVIITMVN